MNSHGRRRVASTAPSGGDGRDLRPADRYVRPGRVASFATVVAAARQRGECAIGYRAHTPGAARRHEGIRLRPAKSERRQWAAEDEIVVLPPGPATADGGPHERDVLPGTRRDTEATDAPAGRPPGAPGGPGP
ncbi:hypothetical protein [Streptomyces sp. NRRL S-31]|uniref:hypothetical protein n=1 Tax=Streptomyces sp. NRRL S-31 TaxID=1463898 RepID=UPI0004C6B77B